MLTNLIMAGILLLLAGTLAAGAKYRPGGAHFFDRENSGILRGLWCIVVVLVHVPPAYQNRLQDMVGSFAYVGVTFFFLTSAYGLRLAAVKRPESLRSFWRHRLPRLLVPCLLANAVHMGLYALLGRDVSFRQLLSIGGWVRWLLVCYLLFWLCCRFLPKSWWDGAICALVAAFSLGVYLSRPAGTTWCPEVFGFAWGILLGRYQERFLGWADRGWPGKTAAMGLLAVALGLGYLRWKGIPFFGDYALKILLGVGILCWILSLNARISIGNRAGRLLGAISYEVYLLHDAAFFALETLCPSMNSGLFILLSLLLTIAVSLAVQRISSRILEPIYTKRQTPLR